MKPTEVTDWPQSSEGTMHEVPRLRTNVKRHLYQFIPFYDFLFSVRVLLLKSTKVTELPQSGEGTMHGTPRLRTKLRGADKGADKPRPLEDIYSLVYILGQAVGPLTTLASWPARPLQAAGLQAPGLGALVFYQILQDGS